MYHYLHIFLTYSRLLFPYNVHKYTNHRLPCVTFFLRKHLFNFFSTTYFTSADHAVGGFWTKFVRLRCRFYLDYNPQFTFELAPRPLFLAFLGVLLNWPLLMYESLGVLNIRLVKGVFLRFSRTQIQK